MDDCRGTCIAHCYSNDDPESKRDQITAGYIGNENIILAVIAILVLSAFSVVCVPADTDDYTVQSVLTMYTTDTLYVYSPTSGRTQMLSVEKNFLMRWQDHRSMRIMRYVLKYAGSTRQSLFIW